MTTDYIELAVCVVCGWWIDTPADCHRSHCHNCSEACSTCDGAT
jgi:hypothetical protein